MSVGRLYEFDVQSGNWTAYVERLEMYFLANDIKEEAKLPVLIAAIGESAYELLSTLASPKKPKELAYSGAVDLLRNHLQPKPSIMAERYKLRQRRQMDSESVSDYITVLKKLAKDCEFGSVLEDNLRDQRVCGIRSDVIRQRLFAEKSLTYKTAVELACSLEAAERDAASVEPLKYAGSSAGQPGSEMHAMHAAASARGSNRSQLPSNDGGGGRASATISPRVLDICGSCGSREHLARDCKFTSYTCSRCGIIGHLRRMCSLDRPMYGGSGRGGRRGSTRGRAAHRTWRGGRGPTASTYYMGSSQASEECGNEEEEEPVMQMSLSQYKPVIMYLIVEDKQLGMEVDTGSALACISKETYEQMFGHLPLLPCELTLKFYDGSKIKPVGYCKARVTYKDCSKILDLYVINKGTTSLLGRQWLAELDIQVPKFKLNSLTVTGQEDVTNEVNKLYSSYAELFDGTLGRFTGGKARLHVQPDAVPVFCRARPLPYALRDRVDAQLDAMLQAGVIEPIESSEWAAPLVPVHKPDGDIRICADFKVSLNKVLTVDRYPVPKIDDLLARLSGSKHFSKIDLSQAYNQIELDETKKYTVINTHRGLFMYNRLVFGLSSSPGIFQRIMANLFKDIPEVVTFLDDILIYSKDKSSHLGTLEKVLGRLKEFGFKLKKEKCAFFVNEVRYLGYIINKEGIHADIDKIKPILDMQIPKNVSELRSFIGMVNFYGRFINNLSDYLWPLYQLLKKGVTWCWGKQQQWAFREVRSRLSSVAALDHYSSEAPVVVSCDASRHGLGAILAQRTADGGERPVMFASRALTTAELNYSQIQKEALAIVFAVKKFHQYLYGRRFTLRTDHKPLVTIFGSQQGIPSMTASRLQRWALILTAYDFEIEFVNSSQNVADALSRMIACHKEKADSEQESPEQTFLHFASEALLLDHNELKLETLKDPLLSKVLGYIQNGWPQEVEIQQLKPFFNRRNELYEELGCVMWGHRVVVPGKCVRRVLHELHDVHMGITKTKQIARSYVWWPGVDEAVEAVCRACEVCARVADAPDRHAPVPWPHPDRPWSRLHLDFLGPIGGVTYLVVVDTYSKWIEISRVGSTSARNVIGKMSDLWARFGIPKQLVSDNGPPFTSKEFTAFLKENGVEQVFSSPYHPSSNGAAENAVKLCKKVINKATVQGVDVDLALNRYLLMYRNTEQSTTGETPAKLLQGRSLRTRLDCLRPERTASPAPARQPVASVRDRHRSFTQGALVWYRTYRSGKVKWRKGKIESRLGETDYNILSEDNTIVHRHVDQIKLRFTNRDATLEQGPRVIQNYKKKSYLIYPTTSGPTVPSDSMTGQGERVVANSPAPVVSQQPTPTAGPSQAAPIQQGLPEGPVHRPQRLRKRPKFYGFESD